MSGQRIGRLSLRLDATYCLLLGVVIAIGAPTLAQSVRLPAAVVVVIGVLVVGWAGIVEWMRSSLDLRLALRIVLIANIGAILAVTVASLAAAALVAALVILAIAVDVGLFAASQAIALTRLGPEIA